MSTPREAIQEVFDRIPSDYSFENWPIVTSPGRIEALLAAHDAEVAALRARVVELEQFEIVCPHCLGAGHSVEIASDSGPYPVQIDVACSTCKGAGALKACDFLATQGAANG